MTKPFSVKLVDEAREALRGIVKETPLIRNRGLSEKYGAKVFLKREDLQVVRSYKLRGAYNRMRLLTPAEKKRGIVCASVEQSCAGRRLQLRRAPKSMAPYSCRRIRRGKVGPRARARRQIRHGRAHGRHLR